MSCSNIRQSIVVRRSTIETLYRLRKAEHGLARRDHALANAVAAAAIIAHDSAAHTIIAESAYAPQLADSIYGESNYLLWREAQCAQVVGLERAARDARSEGQIVNARLAKVGIAFEVARLLRSTAAQALAERQVTETNRDLDELIICRCDGSEAGSSQ